MTEHYMKALTFLGNILTELESCDEYKIKVDTSFVHLTFDYPENEQVTYKIRRNFYEQHLKSVLPEQK